MDPSPDRQLPRDAPAAIRPAWFWAMPVTVLLFLVATTAFLVVLNRQSQEAQRNDLIRDSLWIEQTFRLHFDRNEDALRQIGRDIGQGSADAARFRVLAESILANNKELVGAAWLGPDGSPVVYVPGGEDSGAREARAEAFDRARRLGRAAWSRAYRGQEGGVRVEVHVPVLKGERFVGALAGVYALDEVLHHLVPWWFAHTYRITIADSLGQPLASKLGVVAEATELSHQLAFDPPGHGMVLRTASYSQSPSFARNTLLVVILGLAAVMLASLLALNRHIRRRANAERALREEHAFRKAMEDSLVTGMRVVDLEGRVVYVNPAFCRMTGFEEAELVGCSAPLPYWAPEHLDAAEAVYRRMLAGQIPAGGSELRFRRKSGERFDAILYTAPLIDAGGRQTGWMSSMQDITERKRVREALKASHERFVAVLDGLDAAVSVTDLDSGELLYANSTFRRLFRLDPAGTPCCAVLPWRASGSALRLAEGEAEEVLDTEVQNPADGRLYHVRSRSIRWVDDRQVLLEVAGDVTERERAEEMYREQLEKIQSTSRLITMGEMASTLAHELNQPLSAIASYNTGCLNLLENGEVQAEELRSVLGRIGNQAKRAGRIIQSVRDFVRKSEPRKAPCQLNEVISEAAGFAEIEAKRRSVRVLLELDAQIPAVMADRVMIGQIVLNLMKNGIEAMDATPAEDREVRVSTGVEKGSVLVAVADRGHGVPEHVVARLFDPFFTTKSEGMGMGLNICRSIIEFHNGRLWVEPNPAGGSVFRFSLPLSEAPK